MTVRLRRYPTGQRGIYNLYIGEITIVGLHLKPDQHRKIIRQVMLDQCNLTT